MNTMNPSSDGRFYRDPDRAILGGVCAGVARHLGFNLCATRFITVIAFLMTGPLMIVAYIAAVLLIPSASGREFPYEVRSRGWRCGRSERHDRRAARRDSRAARRDARAARREARDESKRKYFDAPPEPVVSVRAQRVREKCHELDARLQELEKTVTSKKFQIDQELDRL